MGFLDKVFFWRKDELNVDALTDEEIGEGTLQPDFLDDKPTESDQESVFPERFTPESPQAPSPFERPQRRGLSSGGDLELISSKLDTIKAMLSSLEQRMSSLEKAAGIEQKRRLW